MKAIITAALLWAVTLNGQITMNPNLGDFPTPNGVHPQYDRLLPLLDGDSTPTINSPLPVLAGYDFTSWGVSLDNRAATLISPIHFVTARHYRPAVGIEVIYHDTFGNQYVGVVSGYDVIPDTDILVGTFAEQINSAIRPVNILAGRLDTGTEIVAGHKAFAIHVSSVWTYTNDSQYNTLLLAYADPLINYGDSSFPSFVLDDFGNTTVAGTHYRASIGNYALDSSLGLYRDQISAIVSADGYTLGVPEPAHYSLILGLIVLVFLLKRKDANNRN